jgi:ABC-type transport system involved in cytochrome bd biosynthesis fused ATPase/permease subunit
MLCSCARVHKLFLQAFHETGILVGTCVLLAMAFISNMAKDCILETMARAELLVVSIVLLATCVRAFVTYKRMRALSHRAAERYQMCLQLVTRRL